MSRFLTACMVAIAALSPHANVFGQARFDWTKPTVKGDVLERLGPTIRNDILDLTVGKVALSKDSSLFGATVDSAGLHLKIQLYKPEQRLRFDNLIGATGSYKPFRWEPRKIRITKSPHSERFVRKGVLTLLVPHPNAQGASATNAPAKTSPLLPGPETGYKPRNEAFAQLAAAVSGKYKMPGRNTHRPYSKQWMEAARAGADYPAMAVQKYAQAMLAKAKEIREINVAAVRTSLLGEARDVESQIASGAFTRREGTRENGVIEFRTIDESGAARSKAEYLRNVAAKTDSELREWQTTQLETNGWSDLFFGNGVSNNRDHQFQGLVHEAQKVLTEDAAKHAGPQAKTSLVAITRPDSPLIKVRNASGKQLTDVILDLGVGFSRSDKRKAYGAAMLLFVPVWKPNQQLELEFQLKEPRVMHFFTSVYANEASSKEHVTTLVDPKNAPDNRPAMFVFERNAPLGEMEESWAEIDGKRHNWEVGKDSLSLSVEPGEHNVVVKAGVRNRAKEIYQQKLSIDAGDNRHISVTTTIELRSIVRLAANVRAWALVDGKRFDWETGSNTLEVPTTAGEHTVVVKMRAGRRTTEIHNDRVKLYQGQNLRVRIAPGQ